MPVRCVVSTIAGPLRAPHRGRHLRVRVQVTGVRRLASDNHEEVFVLYYNGAGASVGAAEVRVHTTSSDATLASLGLRDGEGAALELSPPFSPARPDYELNLNSSTLAAGPPRL